MEEDGFFDVSDILQSGIYALTWRGEVVYVGQAKRLFVRLYTHASSRYRLRKVTMGKKTIKGSVFDGICVLPCSELELDRREREMIQKYRPKYNEMLKGQMPLPEDIRALLKQMTYVPDLPPIEDRPKVYIRRML